MTAVVQVETPAAMLEKVVVGGDLAKLEPQERLQYYAKVCQSVGLNPLTQPFEYINLNGKLRLYAKRDCTDQLRAIHNISIRVVAREQIGDIYVVTAQAKAKNGREDESTGAVNIRGKAGDDLANAYMKAETKAKRRVTLSIAGLGLLDESEVADLDPVTAEPEERPVVRMPQPLATPRAEEPVDDGKTLQPGQIKVVKKALERAKVDEAALCQKFGVAAIEAIPFRKVNDALAWVTAEGEKAQ